MLHLQGKLQIIFDVLYNLGIIDPVLKMDWQAEFKNQNEYVRRADEAFEICNRHQDNPTKLQEELLLLDEKSLSILAMEVAREYAGFHSSKPHTH